MRKLVLTPEATLLLEVIKLGLLYHYKLGNASAVAN